MGTPQVRGVRARRTHIETYELVGMFDGPSDRFPERAGVYWFSSYRCVCTSAPSTHLSFSLVP